MSTWNKIRKEFSDAQHKGIRQKYVKKLVTHTDRNLLVYFSEFTSGNKPGQLTTLNNSDKSIIFDAIDNLDPNKGIDIMIESPGGLGEAAEAIADMVKSRFNSVRFIVPNMAKSAATVLCLSGDEILMNEQSELGPIDPQMPFRQPNGDIKYSPSHLILQQFNTLLASINNDPNLAKILAPYVQLYFPSFLQECHNARQLVETIAIKLLKGYMLSGSANADVEAKRIASELANFTNFLSHSRAINVDQAISIGLKINDLRNDKTLNDLVNLVYISVVETFNRNPKLVKLIENNDGHGSIQHF